MWCCAPRPLLTQQGGIVQWLEQWNHNPYVVGSTPAPVCILALERLVQTLQSVVSFIERRLRNLFCAIFSL